MRARDNEAIVRGWAQAAFNRHDLDAAAQFHWAGQGEEHGVEALSGWAVPTFSPDATPS